jgi:hypothetical protein
VFTSARTNSLYQFDFDGESIIEQFNDKKLNMPAFNFMIFVEYKIKLICEFILSISLTPGMYILYKPRAKDADFNLMEELYKKNKKKSKNT